MTRVRRLPFESRSAGRGLPHPKPNQNSLRYCATHLVESERNAVDAILQGATQADIFGESAPLPKANELVIVRGMEKKVNQIAAMVAEAGRTATASSRPRSCPIEQRLMADQLAAIERMERELRNVAAQAKIVENIGS